MASPPPQSQPADQDDYSAPATLIPFPRPLPPLRGPIEAGPLDDPSSGPYILAFEDPQSWASAYKSCEAQLVQQCESGARIGCSISASDKCKPAWWKVVLGLSKQDFAERAKCEEAEMVACLEVAKAKCGGFARDKCLPVFRDARIKATSEAAVDWREISRLISWVWFGDRKSFGVNLLGFEKPWGEFKRQFEVTNIRGNDLLGSDNIDIDDYLRHSRKKIVQG